MLFALFAYLILNEKQGFTPLPVIIKHYFYFADFTLTTQNSHYSVFTEIYWWGETEPPQTLTQTGWATSCYVVQNGLYSFPVNTDASIPELTLNAYNEEVRISFKSFFLLEY